MKVLLLNHQFPALLLEQELRKEKLPFNRVGNIIDYIEKNTIKDYNARNTEEFKEFLIENYHLSFVTPDDETEKVRRYYALGRSGDDIYSFRIEEVDDTKPWTIAKHVDSINGHFETIKYLVDSNFIRLNDELNYYVYGIHKNDESINVTTYYDDKPF